MLIAPRRRCLGRFNSFMHAPRQPSSCTVRLALLLAAAGLLARAEPGLPEESFLAPHDKIMWIGDSITAQNLYNPYVMRVLDTLYPDAGLTDVNCGTGGATAPTQFGSIPPRVEKERPTILTVMFGVNDTRWSIGNEAEKIEAYTKGLQQYADLAKQKQLELAFLHETHFSHAQQAAELETGLNGVLTQLFAAEDQLARANARPVIDVFGAYTRALSKAWQVDSKYEFTPNFVHPTMQGHAAVAGEILRAWGAGLPLASVGKRGPLHLDAKQPVELSAAASSGLVAKDGRLAIQVRAAAADGREMSGNLIVVVDKQNFAVPLTLKSKQPVETTIELSATAFSRRWDVLPIYMAFVAPGAFAAAETPLYYSRLLPTGSKPFTHDDKGWLEWEGYKPAASTVSDIAAAVGKQSFRVEFAWHDDTPVAARTAPYKSRLGEPVAGPLDLTAPFGQPCDAVEVLLDLRDEQSTGRCTANMDSIPAGTVRAGLYKIDEGGRSVCRLQVSPESAAGAFAVKELGGDRYSIEWTGMPPRCGVGFNMVVTDAKEYAPNKLLGAWLTSVPLVGVDWTDFFRLSHASDDVFCRVGY
jgi:lysophospholipase L1-like esterase